MTTPERKPNPADAERRLGAQSLHMYEAAQQAIDNTRKLLDEVSQHGLLPRGKAE